MLVYRPDVVLYVLMGSPPIDMENVPDIGGECYLITFVVKIPPDTLYLGLRMWFLTSDDLYLLMVSVHVSSSAHTGSSVGPSLFLMVNVHVVE